VAWEVSFQTVPPPHKADIRTATARDCFKLTSLICLMIVREDPGCNYEA